MLCRGASLIALLALPQSLMHIHDLPNQLVLRVLSLLDPLFVADSVANVCRRWRRLASHSAIWQAVELHYGNTVRQDTALESANQSAAGG